MLSNPMEHGAGDGALRLSSIMSHGGQLEALSGVSAILDLANGLGKDKSVLTGLFALTLAQQAGFEAPGQRNAFFAGLLRHLGCTAFASNEAQLSSDDIALRRRLIHGNSGNVVDVVAAVAESSLGITAKVRGIGRLLVSARNLRGSWTGEACGAARLLASELGFGPDVVQALDEVFERWDGRGGPKRLVGDAISPLGRLVNAAHLAVTFSMEHGQDIAREVLRSRSGTVLQPRWVDRCIELLPRFETRVSDPERLATVHDLLERDPLPTPLETIAATFGDVADLQSPYTVAHSRKVATVCTKAAGILGLPPDQSQDLRLAAHLHDIGQMALPTGLWNAGVWTPPERSRGASHTHYTAAVLGAISVWRSVAEIAASHHERIDGTGTHRGLEGPRLSRAARLLAAADMLCALGEPRAYRPALAADRIETTMLRAVREGHLDPDCVAAVLESIGRNVRVETSPAMSLTPREHEVLALLARGRTNKEIASRLGISPRTVQQHTISIYEKLDVDTRAAAALRAAKSGLV